METFFQVDKKALIEAYNVADEKSKKLLAELFGEKIFSQKITDRIKSFEDACKEVGVDPKGLHFNDHLPKDELAYRKLRVIAHVLNEGWTPNWNDAEEPKWWPWFSVKRDKNYSGGSGLVYYYATYWCSNTCVASSLCFRTKELAEYAGRQFITIYEDYILIR